MDAKTKAEFRTWFNTKWAQWDAKEGRRTTQQELADYLGITRSGVAQYASGRQVPDDENIRKIAPKLGFDIYGVLGKPMPEVDPIDLLPAEFVSALRVLLEEIKEAIEREDVDLESPRATEISNEMLDDFVSRRKAKA